MAIALALAVACMIGCGRRGCAEREKPAVPHAAIGQAIEKLQADDPNLFMEGMRELEAIGVLSVPHLARELEGQQSPNRHLIYALKVLGDTRAIPALVRIADRAGRVEISPEVVFGASVASKALGAREAIASISAVGKTFPGGLAMTTAPPESEHYQNLFRGTTKPYFEAVEAWYHAWRKTYNPDDYCGME